MFIEETFTFVPEINTTLEIRDVNADELISQLTSIEQTLFLIDEHVFSLYFKEKIIQIPYYIVKTGENHKTLKQARDIYDFLFFRNCSRNHKVIVFGGGLTMDLCAWVAGTFKRGTKLWLVPTTLLGMVDASIGGKTGINYQGIKNAIGQFYPAEKVILCPVFLHTLSQKQYYNGIAETCKMLYLLKDYNRIQKIINQKNAEKDDLFLVTKSKIKMCTEDLYDKGKRRTLNLGHTFGHLLESISRYRIPHGSAVVWGIYFAVQYSRYKLLLNENEHQLLHDSINNLMRIDPFFKRYQKMLQSQDVMDLINDRFDFIINNDKKNDSGVNLVLFQEEMNVGVVKESDIHVLKGFFISELKCLTNDI